MKASELRSKDAAELGKELESLLKAQFGLRMQKLRSSLPTPASCATCVAISRVCVPC